VHTEVLCSFWLMCVHWSSLLLLIDVCTLKFSAPSGWCVHTEVLCSFWLMCVHRSSLLLLVDVCTLKFSAPSDFRLVCRPFCGSYGQTAVVVMYITNRSCKNWNRMVFNLLEDIQLCFWYSINSQIPSDTIVCFHISYMFRPFWNIIRRCA